MMLAIDSMIEQAALNDAIFSFALSGGKDCGAALAIGMEYLDGIGHPRENRIGIHADLGRAEWPITPLQVQAQADAAGIPLWVTTAAAGDLPSRFQNRWQRGLDDYTHLRLYNLRGPWSSPSLKFCQSEKKIQVMGPALAKRFRGKTIVQVTGLRRDESRARANTPIAKIDPRFAAEGNRSNTRMLIWNPCVDHTREDVIAINRAYGIPLSPVYDIGCSRHSCSACVMGSINDLTVAGKQQQNFPLFSLYINMEIESTFSFQSGGWLADKTPHLLDNEMAEKLANAKQRGAIRREIEAALPARHRFVKGWPLFIPDQGEAEAIATARAIILDQHHLPNLYPTASDIIERFSSLVEQSATSKGRAK